MGWHKWEITLMYQLLSSVFFMYLVIRQSYDHLISNCYSPMKWDAVLALTPVPVSNLPFYQWGVSRSSGPPQLRTRTCGAPVETGKESTLAITVVHIMQLIFSIILFFFCFFFHNPHKAHPLVHLLGRYGLYVVSSNSASYIELQLLQWCMQYHVILDSALTALDCTCIGTCWKIFLSVGVNKSMYIALLQAHWCLASSHQQCLGYGREF